MKSRNFLHSTTIENQDSATKGFLLAHSPQADVAASSAVRRFELQHNSSPRFARRRQERRQGQALLLAVLIMLIAALLSAGFLGVVSGNLNQSARIADKTRAIEASRAGIAFANAQLSGSSQGDLWRPIDVSPAPDPTSANVAERARYEFYYSQLEKVQGWAAQGQPKRSGFPTGPIGDEDFRIAAENYRNNTYGKFPDPNQVAGDAPKFLVKAEELTTDSTAADYDVDHAGEIKITSIGLSEDDPNVFHRSVAYKKGRTQSPWGEAFRSVSNWDFRRNEVPATNVAADVTFNPLTPVNLNQQVQVSDVLASDALTLKAQCPFNIVIGGKTGTYPLGATVRDVDATGKILTIDSYRLPNNNTTPVAMQKDTTVNLAAAIGTPATIDLFDTGTTPIPDFPDQDQPNGLRVNGSVWLQGHLQLTKLQKNGTKIFSSGYLATSDYSPNPAVPSVQVAAPAPMALDTDVVNGGGIIPSSFNGFPGIFTVKTGVQKLDLIRDGADRLRNTNALGLTYNSTAPNTAARDVEPFKPANISSPENVARFRSLARAPEGVYIDNTEDFEKTGSTPMTQAQLTQMWLSPIPAVATEIFTRDKLNNPTITLPTIDSTTASLEDQHLRGWIGPDEFLARGALVELRTSTTADPGPNAPSPFIRVTLDSRGDNTAVDPRRATGALDSKKWSDAASRPTKNSYTKDFVWPTNGTLFTEGNLRIRGSVTNAPTSLTVVSQGNIYIEGSIGVDVAYAYAYDPNISEAANKTAEKTANDSKKKLMLLARKNVVVNPTRLALGHVEAQATTITSNGTPFVARTSGNLAVATNDSFKIGDVIETSSFPTNPPFTLTEGIRGVITDLPPNAISVYFLKGGIVPTGSTVSTMIRDTRTNDSNPKPLVVNSSTAFSRRVLLQSSPTSLIRLTLDHFGQRKETFKIKTVADPTKPNDLKVYITNKRITPFVASLVQVEAMEKVVGGEYSAPTGSPDDFPVTPTQPYDLAALEAAMDAKTHPVVPVDPLDPRGWKYETEVTPAGASTFPFQYLAGVGLRYSPDRVKYPSMIATDPNTWRSEDIGGTAEFSIPLSTSVQVLRNGQIAALAPQAGVNTAILTKQFGFNPLYAVNGPDLAQEDRLTSDQSFFLENDATANEKSRYSTLDSRILYDAAATPTSSLATGEVLTFEQDKFTGNTTLPFDLLPDYRVKAMKLENTALSALSSQTTPAPLTINAFVYAQEGRWFVIPGGFFRPDSPVRSLLNGAGDQIVATYIDYSNTNPNSPQADPGEYIDADNSNSFTPGDFADLNRNGLKDVGEMDAALRLLRYNHQIKFIGAILENKTAPVNGAVSEWMDKWANYRRDNLATEKQGFNFINYAYDPSIANNYVGSRGLRIPQTDDLLYQQ